MNDLMRDKTIDIFRKTIDNPELIFDGDIENINHFNVLMKAGSKDEIHRIHGCNMTMLNYTFKDEPSIIMIYSIPIETKVGNKELADRVMQIIQSIEKYFITVDYMNSKEARDEKYVYVTIIKSIKDFLEKEEHLNARK